MHFKRRPQKKHLQMGFNECKPKSDLQMDTNKEFFSSSRIYFIDFREIGMERERERERDRETERKRGKER